MRFLLIFFFIAALLPGSYSFATEYNIEICWTIEETADIELAGFRLYDLQQNKICETMDPLDTEMVCTVDVPGTEATFTMVSYSTDGIESDPSDPFTIVFEETLSLEAIFNFTIVEEGSLVVDFDGTASTGSITQYQWNFNDGSPIGNSSTTSHTFPAAGTYTVSLTIQDETTGATTSTSQQISLNQSSEENQAPTASLVITSPAPVGDKPLTVSFDAGGSSDPENSTLTYSWDFGDGATAAGSELTTHQYTAAGTYTAKVTVTDSQGASDSATSQPIMVNAGDGDDGRATAIITVNKTSGPAPIAVIFSGAASTPSVQNGTIKQYSWNFADGSTGSGEEVRHIFTVPGEYKVQLKITDSNGQQAETTKTLIVSAPGTQNIPPTLIEIYKLLLLKKKTVTETEPTVVETSIISGADDAEEVVSSGRINLSSTDLEMIQEDKEQLVGLRFNNLCIPHDATITSAWIQFTVDESTSDFTRLTIEGESIGDAGPFTTSAYNISSRNRTVSAVEWEPPAWSTVGASGPDQQTADIKNIVQEIVGLADRASGNSMVFIISGEGKRVAESYDGVSAAAAVLHVEFNTGLSVN